MSWPPDPQHDYHGPRAWTRTADGRALWVYSCRVQGRHWPLGYCSVRCRHFTPMAAETHYREYLLDTARYDGYWRGVAYRCELCDRWTHHFAQLESFVLHRLCAEHLTREGLSQVLGNNALGAAAHDFRL
jgi:hypothetical protein